MIPVMEMRVKFTWHVYC